MGITLKLNTTKKTLEGKYEFTFKRERKDIKNALIEIKNGNTIGKMFPTSVAISLKKQFQENGYIDANGNLLSQGITFIKYPDNTWFLYSIAKKSGVVIKFANKTISKHTIGKNNLEPVIFL